MSDFLEKLPKALSEEERGWLIDSELWALGTRRRALALIDALTATMAEQAAQLVLDGQRIAELQTRVMTEFRFGQEQIKHTKVAEARVRELEAERRAGEQRWLAAERDGMAAEQKLADANALLERARSEWVSSVDEFDDPVTQELARDIDTYLDAHLAGQPAAPSRPGMPRARFAVGVDGLARAQSAEPTAPSRPPLPARSIPGRPELTEEFPDDAAPDPSGYAGAFGNHPNDLAPDYSDPPVAPSRGEHNIGEFGYCNTCKAFTCTSRTAAEQAVLDAAAAIHPRALKRPLSYVGDWEEFCEAELARRGLK